LPLCRGEESSELFDERKFTENGEMGQIVSRKDELLSRRTGANFKRSGGKILR
jgi:hypothetical protein